MKFLIVFYIILTAATLSFAQTPSSAKEKTKEAESGQGKADSTHSESFSGSAQGKSGNFSTQTDDSIKQDKSDTATTKQLPATEK